LLTQIIVEDAKEPDSPFPLDILRQMVVASGRATQETTLKYTKAVLDMYQNAYRAMAPPVNPFEFIQTPASPEVPWSSQPPEGSHKAGAGEPKKHETVEVDELKQRVEELESLVSKLGAGKTARKRKGKARNRR
jgi:hypothetical protein